MDYSKIVAVTGMPGLFELVSSKNDGALVRSLHDGTTRFVSTRAHNFSHLESIEVYTTEGNVNLAEVFLSMKTAQVPTPDEKDGAGIRSYFEKVFPRMDFERVYQSDMKKMIRWHGILTEKQVEVKLPEKEDTEGEETAE
jgi:hypothetical protein